MPRSSGVITGVQVPVAELNTLLNSKIQEVLGNREDTSFNNNSHHPTVIGHLKADYNHIHDPSKVYPSLADAVVVTAGTGVWTPGTKIELIPAGGIPEVFDLHWFYVNDISASDQYELIFYKGAAEQETEIGRGKFFRSSNFSQEGASPFQGHPVPAGSRISVALACKSGSARTCGVSVYYHTYPDITI